MNKTISGALLKEVAGLADAVYDDKGKNLFMNLDEINSGAELFGNFTRLKNGELAKNGAEALKDLDDNNDGLFDESDKAFNEILVWQDINSNGKAESSELKTLKEHGIKSINLEFSTDNTALDKDNKQILVGSFSINDSDNAFASDIDFSVNSIKISA